MREFSHKELAIKYSEKISQLEQEKSYSKNLANELQKKLFEIEHVVGKLTKAENELTIQRDQLLEENRIKTKKLLENEKFTAIGELSARIAHDMRNPLSIIKNSIEMIKLEQKDMDKNTREHFARTERSIYRILHQIEDVLGYVKSRRILRTKQKILPMLKEAVERVSIPSHIKVILPKNDFVIPYDTERLEAVFVNLIMNAVQAMGKKKGRIFINITEEDKKLVLIKVKDEGPGIPKKLLGKIFDPLFTTRQIGTGLGLPSCKVTIEKHGGSIDVVSSKKRGTTFLIRLPKKTEWDNISKTINKEKLTENIFSM